MTREEEDYGKSGSGQDDITALGGVLEFWFIPDIKSPSRLAIYYRSRLDDVAAGPLHHRNPIKRNPCESTSRRRSCNKSHKLAQLALLHVLPVQRFWLLLTTYVPRFQAFDVE